MTPQVIDAFFSDLFWFIIGLVFLGLMLGVFNKEE